MGGPVVIPKVYDGRKRQTFFFANLDEATSPRCHTQLRQYRPSPSFLQGDFSSPLLLNTTTPIATDALGRPIYAGEIFNPATTRLVGGIPVRDGYGFDPVTGLPIAGQANIIPANDPLRSQIAAKLVPLIPAPNLPGKLVHNEFSPRVNRLSFAPRPCSSGLTRLSERISICPFPSTSTRGPGRGSVNTFSEGCNVTSPSTYFGQGYTRTSPPGPFISSSTGSSAKSVQPYDYLIRPLGSSRDIALRGRELGVEAGACRSHCRHRWRAGG